MSTVRCTCLIPNCKFFGKTEFADVRFIIYHLNRHSYNELRLVAVDNQIITSNGKAPKDWLVRELARACNRGCC